MPELQQILEVAERAGQQGDEVCLVTVVGAEGSSYRKPGARMLLTGSGQRAGTISGGCLEGEVSKKAWWLTASGPSVQRYSSFFDEDSGTPYGLGCGGTVVLLLERGRVAERVIAALRRTVERRESVAILTATGGAATGTQMILGADGNVLYTNPALGEAQQSVLRAEAARCLSEGSRMTALPLDSGEPRSFFCERVDPAPALWLFGAGDDAQPLVEFGHKLGWFVTVADGRSQLARPERFPFADQVLAMNPGSQIQPAAADAVVLMTHSYEQDRELLRQFLPLDFAYLGILGPRRRTLHIVEQLAAANEISMPAEDAMERLHAPVGLSIHAHSPAAIALSIAAEIHAVLAARQGTGRATAAHSCSNLVHAR